MRQPNLSDRKQVSIMRCMQAGGHQNEIDTEEWMRNEDEDGAVVRRVVDGKVIVMCQVVKHR